MKHLLLALALLLLPACSTLNPFDVLTDKPSLDISANVGENVSQEKSNIKLETGRTEQTADEISNDTAYNADSIQNITNQMPPWMFFVMVFLAGWAIPDYKICFCGLGKTIKAPFIGTANFILKLLGRESM